MNNLQVMIHMIFNTYLIPDNLLKLVSFKPKLEKRVDLEYKTMRSIYIQKFKIFVSGV